MSGNKHLNRHQLLDIYFPGARASLIDLAAFLDRVERAEGGADFRLVALREAMGELGRSDGRCAERVLLCLSDPTTEPVERAESKGAVGAYPKDGMRDAGCGKNQFLQ